MSKKIPIIPLSDRVVLVPKESESKTSSGIYIPDNANKEKPGQGKIVAVGPGRYDDGVLIPMTVKVGQEVLFSKYSPEELDFEGQKYFVVSESNILAIIEN